jgi:uncharacterized OsmC-like protein
MAAQTSPQPDIREYEAQAKTTDTFGRVMCNTRNHHIVVDGPVANGCPGEEITPAELFLTSVAACGAELVQVIARKEGIPLQSVNASIRGVQDRSNPARQDFSVFNTVRMEFNIKGVTEEQGAQLVEAFKRR